MNSMISAKRQVYKNKSKNAIERFEYRLGIGVVREIVTLPSNQ